MENKKIRVLIVDDEPEVLDLFKELFVKKDFEAIAVASGMEALELIEREELDIVLLDIKMPGIDGIETLEKLKQKKPSLPVVMLTAYGYDDNLVNKTLELGASGYISKNLPLMQILHTFKTILNSIQKRA